jgi:cleavage stimulation factor subunit 3
MDALRKVYHRAVQIPIENIERLWSELETFESNLNKITVILLTRMILNMIR